MVAHIDRGRRLLEEPHLRFRTIPGSRCWPECKPVEVGCWSCCSMVAGARSRSGARNMVADWCTLLYRGLLVSFPASNQCRGMAEHPCDDVYVLRGRRKGRRGGLRRRRSYSLLDGDHQLQMVISLTIRGQASEPSSPKHHRSYHSSRSCWDDVSECPRFVVMISSV